MKVEESVRKELLENLNIHLIIFNKMVERILSEMVNVNTVEELMKKKKELLEGWLDSLPLGGTLCYFCIKYNKDNCIISIDRCRDCEYAEAHGCCIHETSDYVKIMKKINDAQNAIAELYYKNEKYENVKETEKKEKVIKFKEAIK